MEGFIYISGELGVDYTIQNALMDINRNKLAETITLKIGSIGGYVDKTEEIYNVLKNTGKITKAYNTGDVASAAVKLFLLAPKNGRFFDSTKGKFLIHNPYGTIKGDASVLNEVSKEMARIENDMASFYAKATESDIDIIKGFMKINEPLTDVQISELGFANLYTNEFQAVAKININEKINEMALNDDDKSWFESIVDKLFSKKIEAKALMIADADGKNLDFGEQIQEESQIAVGMTAKYDDGTLPNGEVVLPSGNILVFDNGNLTEIKDAGSENQEMEALKTENETLKTEIEALKAAQANAPNLESVKASMESEFLALMEERIERKEITPQSRISDFSSKMK